MLPRSPPLPPGTLELCVEPVSGFAPAPPDNSLPATEAAVTALAVSPAVPTVNPAPPPPPDPE